MEKKTSKNTLLAIMGVLILAVLLASFFTMQKPIISNLFTTISLAFTALYSFWLYKKPHGNILKYAILLFTVAVVINGAYYISLGNGHLYIHIIRLLAAVAIGYGAGRLNRIEQNKILFPVVDVALLICAIIDIVEGGINYGIWVILMILYGPLSVTTFIIAYILRYKEHKEAGLADK